jgi:hypothetical protein
MIHRNTTVQNHMTEKAVLVSKKAFVLQRYASFSKDVSVVERHPFSVSGIEVKSKEGPDPGAE